MGFLDRSKDTTTAPSGDIAGTVSGHSALSPERGAGSAGTAVFSGIAFAVLFTLGLVLVNQIPRLDSPDSTYTAFYTTGSGGVLMGTLLAIGPNSRGRKGPTSTTSTTICSAQSRSSFRARHPGSA